ncbi:MAG: DEAD/DEAH box helicase family protein [Anaerolineae bacterium]|nr:DEAD/DEAH box helicase family protein [Anaerolineae bacterium]
MPRRSQPRPAQPLTRSSAPVVSAAQQYVKLENRLVLLAWLNSLFGYTSNREMLQDCQTVDEGYDSNGNSFLYHHLVGRGSKVQIPSQDLARYDKNIRDHLSKINHRRTTKIILRYFQHLAALYAEIFLDRLFNHRAQLLADLNAFVKRRNQSRYPSDPQDPTFTDADLDKLAFWMATGSGKTLLMHLNYYQYLHYAKKDKPDNVLLVTPNEGLTEQHLAELDASGIPAQRFGQSERRLSTQDLPPVQVIEITKLVETKQGGGVSVSVETFEGRNLVFVDEGHKGSGGVAWRRYRDALGKGGFTFEYSATFGQALSAVRDDSLTTEYGKAIAFDYSYKYFYSDGFGKDFRVLNLRDSVDDTLTDRLLMGNLLSFYEQLCVFETQSSSLRSYNLEKPLWVFVGSTVNAVYTEHGRPRSDVLTVARFFHRVLSNRRWAEEIISLLLNGQSGLTASDGSDLFLGRFPAIRQAEQAKQPGQTAAAIYDDILRRIFHTEPSGGLHLVELKRASGELGLRAAGANEYFGVIYIGDVSAFKNLVQQDAGDIVLEQDAIRESLFARINTPDSPIHVLIGARKFIEGWNSWRVSSMGLLNIGRNEGAQIIQLFGRGVRLKGKDLCLKRSSALPGPHPQYIALLETLNIFAVRANYMAQFRDYLEREGIEVDLPIELPLLVGLRNDLPNRGLVVPRPAPDTDFIRQESLLLKADPNVSVELSLLPRVQAIQSTGTGLHVTQTRAGQAQPIPAQSLNLVDWQQVYLDVLEHKQARGMSNLVIPSKEVLREIAALGSCRVVAEPHVLTPQSLENWHLLQQAVTRLLCLYVDQYHRARRETWESSSALIYQKLDDREPNLSFSLRNSRRKYRPAYIMRIPRSEAQLIQQVKQLQRQVFRLYRRETPELPRIHFDRHVYFPLLIEHQKIAFDPPGLKESEKRFVLDLRDYWRAHHARLQSKEIFLLRNLSRGRGIGFFEGRGFYPDFILWVLDQATQGQRIVFIEPHGMLFAQSYANDEKARLWERLPKLAQEIAQRSLNAPPVSLDSYIVSATPFDDLRKHYDDGRWDRDKFAQHHILFQERTDTYDYMSFLLQTSV